MRQVEEGSKTERLKELAERFAFFVEQCQRYIMVNKFQNKFSKESNATYIKRTTEKVRDEEH